MQLYNNHKHSMLLLTSDLTLTDRYWHACSDSICCGHSRCACCLHWWPSTVSEISTSFHCNMERHVENDFIYEWIDRKSI